IEVYSPRKDSYFEVGSCSNLTDAQARRLGIKVGVGKESFVPHTLNNTALATSRALVAILENHQTADGRVRVPKSLRKYLDREFLTPRK
ncbi:serine--tRNA ligase, partial [Candidatus Pacearchaeota archaeon]